MLIAEVANAEKIPQYRNDCEGRKCTSSLFARNPDSIIPPNAAKLAEAQTVPLSPDAGRICIKLSSGIIKRPVAKPMDAATI